MNELFVVRAATIADLPRVISVFDSYRAHFKQPKNPAAVESFLFDRFEHRESVLFVTEHQGNIIGFAHLYPSFSSLTLQRVWILNDFYITEQFRGQGAGNGLLHTVKDYARLTRAKGIELTVEHANTGAWRFWERHGFELDKDFRTYFHKLPEN